MVYTWDHLAMGRSLFFNFEMRFQTMTRRQLKAKARRRRAETKLAAKRFNQRMKVKAEWEASNQ